MKKRYTIPVFVPHIGCPHDCVFCNQHTITGAEGEVTSQSVRDTINEHLKYIDSTASYVEVAFFGGSFTGICESKQTELLETAYEYVKAGKVHALRCSTRPDFIDESVLNRLKKYNMKTIELGVQSTDDEVLELSARGHSRDDVIKASNLIREHGFDLGLQMMPFLPGDTVDKTLNTARDIISLKPVCVRIYPTLVVRDTELCRMYERGEYTPASVDEAVDVCSQLVEMFEEAGVDIIRIGLQSTDSINASTIVGPYHEAIGELVYGRVYRNRIEKYITERDIKGSFTYFVPQGDVSKAVGHKKANIDYFKQKYDISVTVKEE